MRLFGGVRMTDELVESYARQLKDLWVAGNTLSGAIGYRQNESEKQALLKEAEALGIRHEVYARAGDLLHGVR